MLIRSHVEYQKPYPEGTRDPGEIQFNKQLSAARVKVKCAFGILKGGWRILSLIKEASVARVSKIIVACTVLHNFCILNRDEWDFNVADDGDDGQNPNGDVAYLVTQYHVNYTISRARFLLIAQ